MTEPVAELEAIHYRRLFPWLDLFRAFGLAFELRKMALAAFAILAIAGGEWMMSGFPVGTGVAVPSPWSRHWSNTSGGSLPDVAKFIEAPWQQAAKALSNWRGVLVPERLLLDPIAGLFRSESWSQLGYQWGCLAWGLCVWGVCAGALVRMSAVQYAREESISVWTAVKFAGRRILAYLLAPALPLAGVIGLWFLCMLIGWCARIPMIGELLIGIGWCIPLVCGMLMALILMGLAIGWPLMFATISVEREDGFDALSRAYSYVYDRPWHCVLLAVIALTYGSLMIFLVDCSAQWIIYLSAHSVGWGLGTDRLQAWFQAVPGALSGMAPSSTETALNESPGGWGPRFIAGWIFLVQLLVAGFVHSYFWSATTIIYFLLRRSSDATDLDEIEIDIEEEEDDLLALVQTSTSILVTPPVSSEVDLEERSI